jgi:CubicO group peptidase (beta-lactamase class C family)
MDALTTMSGVAVATRAGEVVVEHVGGTADGLGEPNTLSTRFQIASVSKSFTAAAVVLLAERAALHLTDRLERWLDDCPERWRAINLEQLLTHSAGLVHWEHLEGFDWTKPIAMDELVARFAAEPLLSEPGERFSYSSPGYVLLSLVVEACAGEPYASFLGSDVMAPLGLADSFAGNGHGRAGLATPLEGGAPITPNDLDVVSRGAGDVWSTARDVLAFDEGLLAGRLISPAAVVAATRPRVAVTEQPSEAVHVDGYGHGWFVGEVVGHRILFHPGGNAGFQSLNAVLPDDDVRAVLLTNDAGTDIAGCSLALLARAFGLA